MSTECFPITVLPHVSPLYRDYLGMAESAADAPVRTWYGCEPFAGKWLGCSETGGADRDRLADALAAQNREWNAGEAALANIEKLRQGARALVTGQQVGLLGGPLLTILKAATAVSRAREATRMTGVEHVPVFWLATEDHDLAEVNQVALLGRTGVETLRAEFAPAAPVPVGGVVLGPEMDAVLDRASDLLDGAPECDFLRQCYAPGETLGSAFAKLMAHMFAEQGLIVLDASGREFHAMGAPTLRYAIEHAAELETALLHRGEALEAAGYHAQVLVVPGASLLFLTDEASGARQALKRVGPPVGAGGDEKSWKAGRELFSTADLLGILERTPERLSPNALLRAVFQDTILPTAAYVGGPAEIAYFAQSAVLYEAILGRVTPVLPRLSATLLEPAVATLMARHEVQLPDAMTSARQLAQRLGARAMPIAGKRKLAAVGNAMDAELTALTEYMTAMDASLGRAAGVSASKMRYQMNRLRRMAANFELEKEASLERQAEMITSHVFPDGHPQERLLAGVWFIARYGEGLVERLVGEAANQCPGHVVVRL